MAPDQVPSIFGELFQGRGHLKPGPLWPSLRPKCGPETVQAQEPSGYATDTAQLFRAQLQGKEHGIAAKYAISEQESPEFSGIAKGL